MEPGSGMGFGIFSSRCKRLINHRYLPVWLNSEIACEPHRQAEPQGGTTITLGNSVPAPNPVMSTSPESLPTEIQYQGYSP
jgi:hypothetical protein